MYCEEDKKKRAGGEAAGIYNYHPLKNKKKREGTFQIFCWREKRGMSAPHLMSSSSTSTCTSRINAAPPLSVTINVYINPPASPPQPAYTSGVCRRKKTKDLSVPSQKIKDQ